MNPIEYKYTQEHVWIRLEPDNTGKVGITDYAQSQLGAIVFFSLPDPDTEVQQFNKMGEVESIKTVSDIFSPVSGHVLEINQTAIGEPGMVNQDPYGEGWLVRLKLVNPAELDSLMDADKYDQFVAELSLE